MPSHLEGSVYNNKTLTPAIWIRSLNLMTLHSNQLWGLHVIYVYLPWCRSPVCSPWFVSTSLCLSACCWLSIQPGLIRLVLCSGLRRAWGAWVMPPHVHPGWKVRTLRTERSGLLEKTCQLCSACLTLGKGWQRGWGQEYVRRREQWEKKTSATKDEWQTSLL